MIPNCLGCKYEYDMLLKYVEEGLHFAGEGLGERSHLFIRMVNDKGKIIIG